MVANPNIIYEKVKLKETLTKVVKVLVIMLKDNAVKSMFGVEFLVITVI